jgi:hypothetical protein
MRGVKTADDKKIKKIKLKTLRICDMAVETAGKIRKTLRRVFRPVVVAGILYLLGIAGIGMVLFQIQAGVEKKLQEMEARTVAVLVQMEKRTAERLETVEREITAEVLASALDTQDAILGTRRQVSRLDATYGDLLEAQKRRTLEGLYVEDTLAEQRVEAGRAFESGRYMTASRLWGEIARAHQEDQEARFYQYYAFFLYNRQDRNNYRAIEEAFILLEKQGYTRQELVETLAFIAAEKGIEDGEEVE